MKLEDCKVGMLIACFEKSSTVHRIIKVNAKSVSTAYRNIKEEELANYSSLDEQEVSTEVLIGALRLFFNNCNVCKGNLDDRHDYYICGKYGSELTKEQYESLKKLDAIICKDRFINGCRF